VLGRAVRVGEQERERAVRRTCGVRHDRVRQAAAAARRGRVDALDLAGVRRREQQAGRDRAPLLVRAERPCAGQRRPVALPAQHRRDRRVAAPWLGAQPLLAQWPDVVGGDLGDRRRGLGRRILERHQQVPPDLPAGGRERGRQGGADRLVQHLDRGRRGEALLGGEGDVAGAQPWGGGLDADRVDLAHPRDTRVEDRGSPRQWFRSLGDRILDRAQVRDDAVQLSPHPR
jgi:hypothetical protein